MVEQVAVCSKTKFMDILGIKDATFRTLIDAGMPARYENGRWYISMNNFQAWFDNWTAVRPAVDDFDKL